MKIITYYIILMFFIALLTKDNYIYWSGQVQLIFEINECSLEEVLILEDGAQSAAHRKKILKVL